MLSVKEINEMDGKTILGKLAELKKDIFNLKFSKGMSGLEKPHLLKEKKKDVARLLTVLNQRGEK